MKTISQLSNKMIKRIAPDLLIDFGGIQNAVFLAGTGRSGTTWLQEMVSQDGSYRIIFEPFHQNHVPLASGWNHHQYLRTENQDEKFIDPVKSLLSGEFRNRWMDYYNNRIFARKRLIKAIRANLFLQWMTVHFPQVPVVLILRHPCAAVNSALKLDWKADLEGYLAQENLVTDFLDPFVDRIQGAQTAFEKLLLNWCVQNYVPLKQFRRGEILVTFYENLCENPQSEMDRIFSFIKQSHVSGRKKIDIRPSWQSKPHSAVVTGKSLIGTWREDVSKSEIDLTLEVLSLFGLDQVYGEDNLPLVNEEDVFDVF